MTTRTMILLALFCGTLALGGCVSSGTYRIKAEEAAALDRTLHDLQQKYADLSQEHDSLKAQMSKLDIDLAAVRGDRDRLVASEKVLGESLKLAADDKNQRIGELSQKISDLEKDNARLKEQTANIMKDKAEAVQKTSKTYEEMLEKMKGEISRGQVTISELKGKLTVNMLNAILFGSGKAEIRPEGKAVLQKVVDILKNVTDKTVRIEGYTDNVPIARELAGAYPTNWELSAARAINVTRYLQQQGIDPSLLSAVAYGEYRPVAANDTEEGKARNRRIEIILVPKD